MAALATDTLRLLAGAKILSIPIKNAAQLYVGSFTSVIAGYCQPFAGATGEMLVGRCLPTPSQALPTTSPFQLTGNTAPAAGLQVPEATICVEGEVLLQVSVTGVTAQTNLGNKVYLNSDDNDITLTRPARGIPFGVITRWNSGTTCSVTRFSFEALCAIMLGGNGAYVISFPINLPDYTTATDYTIATPPFGWTLRSTSATVLVAPTGSSGVTTFQPKIGATAVTGGLVTVSTGDATAAIDAGTAVSALNVGSESSVLKLTVTKTGTVTTGSCLLTLIFDKNLAL